MNLDNILKSRDITLPTIVRLVKAMIFPVVMYGCKSWTVKKAEYQRIDAHLIIEANKRISKSKKLVLESFSQTLCPSLCYFLILCLFSASGIFFTFFSCPIQCMMYSVRIGFKRLHQR